MKNSKQAQNQGTLKQNFGYQLSSEFGINLYPFSQNQSYFWNSFNCQPAFVFPQISNELMAKTLFMANINTLQLQNLSQKIKENQMNLIKIQTELDNYKNNTANSEVQPQRKNSKFTQNCKFEEGIQPSFDLVCPLVDIIFGKKQYKYRLELQDPLPDILYKERIFNLKINLVDLNNQKVLNSNIMSLRLAVCDSNGKWITENRIRQPILKGRTEAELYHGEATFRKVFSRQLSKHHPGKRLNFVIYPSPSLVKMANICSCVEDVVNFEEIEPLIIKDIRIVSKKY